MGLLSKTCVYGLRAGLYIVAHQDGRAFVPIHEIAGHLGVSFHFLTKILQKLTEDGIMVSNRGPRGGVALAMPAGEISLARVVQSLDGPDIFSACVMGLAGCGDRRPCPMHKQWVGLRRQLKAFFDGASLGSTGRQALDAGLRLAD